MRKIKAFWVTPSQNDPDPLVEIELGIWIRQSVIEEIAA